jgi:hypothetical protein
MKSFARRHKKKLIALALLVCAPVAAHGTVAWTTRIRPPAVELPRDAAIDGPDGIRHVGAGYTRVRAGIREVLLEGPPERIGAEQARLLRERMVENELVLWSDFSKFVPVAAARTLMFDLSRVRYRHIDSGIPEARRRELAAQAAAFAPDPYEDHLPTYHRMVFFHALYDIALSFEHSPLLGCSSFVLGPTRTKGGHTLLARAFDFEAGDVFDRDKAVFLVKGDGALPFASVAWPGMIGVMSGMNSEGVALVVHGGRAKEPQAEGEPVIFSLREVLERAKDTDEATHILSTQRVMVSHMVLVADAHGKSAVVERAPGAQAFVREAIALTNHFEGPLASDPKNLRVRENTTTLPRRARLDEMLAGLAPNEGSVQKAVAMLRDHTCAGGAVCELGDRRTIDATIATHGIVADTTERVLWVSAGPHLSGRFVKFDLKAIFASDHDPTKDTEPETIAEDPILFDGRYEAAHARAGAPRVGGDKK